MKKYLLIWIWILTKISFAQTPYTIKEQFDQLEPFIHDDKERLTLTSVDDHDALGDGMSMIIASYLRLYEVTKDKAYLVKNS